MEIVATHNLERELEALNREQARLEYLALLDKVIERLIVAENLIYDKERAQEYTLEDLYSIVGEALKESRANRLIKYKPKTLKQYKEQLEAS